MPNYVLDNGVPNFSNNSVALIDTYTVTIASSTASINPMSGSAQFVPVITDTLISASFSSVPSDKSVTTAVWVSSTGGNVSFAGVNYWMGTTPTLEFGPIDGMLVLTNFISGSTSKIIGSWQALST